MAHAALVSAAQTMEPIMLHVERYSTLDEKQLFKSLHQHLISLQVLLEDVTEFETKAQDIFIEERIRDVANEAEDVIEEFESQQVRSQFPDSDENLRHHFEKLYEGLQNVAKKIESLVGDQAMGIRNISQLKIKETQLINDSSSIATDYNSSSSPSRLEVATGKENVMVGFEEDMRVIKGRLAGESSTLQFIPIYGMGGIGKTTLAKNAYNDQLCIEIFDLRAWVTVSQNYSARDVILSLLISFGSFSEFLLHKSDAEIALHAYKSLKSRRYLLVLDDVWSTKVWDDVKRILPDDRNGSRIMFTTRLSDVAFYVDSGSLLIHEMHFLNADQSWDLLREKVFGQETNCPPELESIGKLIAQRCGGLPLAIVVIAGVLSTVDPSRASWENVGEAVNAGGVATTDEQFEKIFSLSYIQLPRHLRSCFLYIGSFPKDEEIRVRRLIKLWVAEGFLPKPISGSKSLEERAEECLEDLVRRSLVLVSKRSSRGKIKSCAIHDVLRDICIRKSQQEKFLLSVSGANNDLIDGVLPETILKNQRRVGMFPSQWAVLKDVISSGALRTILYLKRGPRLPSWLEAKSLRLDGAWAEIEVTLPSLGSHTITNLHLDESELSYLEGFRLLRVLDALEIRFKTFPRGVLELVLLRYLALNLEWSNNSRIPNDILKLQKLQTLILRPVTGPKDAVDLELLIWKMPELRHIDVGPILRISVPNQIESCVVLHNLQTLSVVANFKWTKEYCETLPNLKKLAVTLSVSKEGEQRDDGISSLVHLLSLEELKLDSGEHGYSFSRGFAFPETLKKLTLEGVVMAPYLGIVGSLPNLEVLKLKTYYNYLPYSKTWETKEGQFPRLKSLLIEGTNLELWITKSNHFPSLKHLRLYGCRRLRQFPEEDIGEIAALELIEVDNANKSLVDSIERIQQEQQDLGNELQVNIKICPTQNSITLQIRSDVRAGQSSHVEVTVKH